MSTVTFHVLDERRTGLSPGYLCLSNSSPLVDEGGEQATWPQVPPTVIANTREAREAFIEVVDSDALHVGDEGLRSFLAYYTHLLQLQTHMEECIGYMDTADDAGRGSVEDVKGVHRWVLVENIIAVYNMAIAKARQATHIRFTGGDDTTDDDRLGPECQHSAEGRRLGHIAKVQRLFEESAGLLDLLMTQGSQCGVLDQTSYPELDSAFCRTLKLTFLGCAQETLWLFNTLKNEDGRLCGLLGSSIGYFFAQAEAVCQGIRNRELRHYTRVLENTLGVKRSYYNGVAHYFFNGRSAKRRRRAQEHLEGAMQLLTRVESAFRKQVADEIMGMYQEIATWKENKMAQKRFPSGNKGATGESRVKPSPRLPREVAVVDMYLYWKRCALRSGAGPARKEWWEEEDAPVSPAVRSAVARRGFEHGAGKTAPKPEHALQLRCVQSNIDACAHNQRSDPDMRVLSCVVDIRAPRPVNRDNINVCLILIIDCQGDMLIKEQHVTGAISQLLSELVEKAGFRHHDQLGVMMFNHHTQEPQLQMFRMDEDGISVAQKAIRSLRRTANVSLAHAVEAALDYLNNMSVAASSYELLLISDGHDSGGFKGAWNNWGKFHDVLGLIEETTNDPGKKQIRMHGFAVGPRSDKYFIEAVCQKTGGDYAYADANEEGLSQIRAFLLKHCAAEFNKVATKCYLEIECAKGVAITQVGTKKTSVHAQVAGEGHFEFGGKRYDKGAATSVDRLHDWLLWEHAENQTFVYAEKLTISLDDFSIENRTEIPFGFHVAKPVIQRRAANLANIRLTYTDAEGTATVTLEKPLEVNDMPILLEPSQLPFASSAFVLNTTGDVELTPTIVVPPQSSHTLKLHRGHWIDIKDVVRIPGGTFLEAVFADNTKLSVEENSKFEITHSDMVEARICINLAKGNICVTTASHSSVSIQCYPYTVLVTTGTMAKISFAEGVLHANAIIGTCYITTATRTERVMLPAQKEVACTFPAVPPKPWVMKDGNFRRWLQRQPDIHGNIKIENAINRICAAQSLLKVAGLLRKKCMPATVSNANIRSLNFLVWYWSKQAGKRSSNSLAFSTDDSRLLNKLAIRYAHAADEAATIPKSTVLRMEEDAASLVCQRCRGSSELFVAVTQTQFLKDYAQARKQELEQVKEEEHQKSALGDTREAKRRAGIIDQLFMKLDFNCSGYIEFHELQQVMISFALKKRDQFPKFVTRWESLIDEAIISLEMDKNQFIVLVQHLTADSGPHEFDTLIAALRQMLTHLDSLLHGSRKSRAVWNLFQKWDRMRVGFIDADEIIEVVGNTTHAPGSDTLLFRGTPNYEDMTKELQLPMHELTGHQDDDSDTVQQVHMERFHSVVYMLLHDHEEMDFHGAISMIAYELSKQTVYHDSVEHAYHLEEQKAEKTRLVTQDLKHCFDGVFNRDLQRLVGAKWKPDNLEDVSKAICVLAGIPPKTDDGVHLVILERKEEWYRPLMEVLQENMADFFDFLKNFPIMAISYQQCWGIYGILTDKRFEASLMTPFSHIFSALVTWCKLVFRIATLENNWTWRSPEERSLMYRLHEQKAQHAANLNIRSLMGKKKIKPDGRKYSVLDTSTRDYRLDLRARIGVGNLASLVLDPPKAQTVSLHVYHSGDNAEARKQLLSSRTAAPADASLIDGVLTKPLPSFLNPRPSSAHTSLKGSLAGSGMFLPRPRSSASARSQVLYPPSTAALSPKKASKAAAGSGFAAARTPPRCGSDSPRSEAADEARLSGVHSLTDTRTMSDFTANSGSFPHSQTSGSFPHSSQNGLSGAASTVDKDPPSSDDLLTQYLNSSLSLGPVPSASLTPVPPASPSPKLHAAVPPRVPRPAAPVPPRSVTPPSPRGSITSNRSGSLGYQSAINKRTEVAQWLESTGLSEWASSFEAEGYDDMEDLKSLVKGDNGTLQRLVTKEGHRLKMLRLLTTAKAPSAV